jgi:DNA-binding transcriptional ArsR family regulator
VAIPEWELNLFNADPRLLRPQEHPHYVRAAAALADLATPSRVKLLHALLVGERSVQRAAVWAGLPQPLAAADLRALEARGLVRREESSGEIEFVPVDGHLVALLYLALAHGTHTREDGSVQPLLLREKRRLAGTPRRPAAGGGGPTE